MLTPKRVCSANFVVADVTLDVLLSHPVVAKSLVVQVAALQSQPVVSKQWVVQVDAAWLHLAADAKSHHLAVAAVADQRAACSQNCSAARRTADALLLLAAVAKSLSQAVAAKSLDVLAVAVQLLLLAVAAKSLLHAADAHRHLRSAACCRRSSASVAADADVQLSQLVASKPWVAADVQHLLAVARQNQLVASKPWVADARLAQAAVQKLLADVLTKQLLLNRQPDFLLTRT